MGDRPSAFLQAVADGSVSEIDALLKAGAPVNARTPTDERSALMIAAARGDVLIVELLLGAGASLTAQDITGKTALMHAAAAQRLLVIDLLLRAGADPSIRARDGSDALRFARRRTVNLSFLRGWHVTLFFNWSGPAAQRLLRDASPQPTGMTR
jgi:uncharacterized protein